MRLFLRNGPPVHHGKIMDRWKCFSANHSPPFNRKWCFPYYNMQESPSIIEYNWSTVTMRIISFFSKVTKGVTLLSLRGLCICSDNRKTCGIFSPSFLRDEFSAKMLNSKKILLSLDFAQFSSNFHRRRTRARKVCAVAIFSML